MAASVEGGMYRLPNYYNNEVPLSLPTCMYNLPNYHKSSCSYKETDKSMTTGEMQSLLNRQEAILCDLALMKAEVEGLATKLGVSLPEVRTGSPAMDLVISASTEQPPLSLFALQHLLCVRKKTHSTSVFVHSSLKEPVPPHLMKPFCYVQENHCKGSPVAITLVWKEVEDGPTLAVHPGHSLLHGEATIARYLCRSLLPDLYGALAIDDIAAVDVWLDVSRTLTCGNNKEKATALKLINTQLQKSEWLVNNKITLADICIASTLKKTNVRAVGSVSEHVETWLKKIPGIGF